MIRGLHKILIFAFQLLMNFISALHMTIKVVSCVAGDSNNVKSAIELLPER